MHRKRSIRIGRCALIVAAALGLSVPIVRAETFKWKDGRVARGRVLAAWKDFYFAELESDPARFVDARELEAVLDDEDRVRSDFGKVRAPAPLFAVDGVVSEVHLERKADLSSTKLGEEPSFAFEGDRVSTGDAGLARLAFPSTAVARLGAKTSVIARASESIESLELEKGEVFVAPELAGFDVRLATELRVRAREGVFEIVRVPGATIWRITAHRGRARIEGETFRVEVAPGLTSEIERLRGGVRITAELANPTPLEMAVGTNVRTLAPGETFLVSTAARVGARPGGTWKLARVVGTVSVRRAPTQGDEEPAFHQVSAIDAPHVLLEPGDAVSTGGSSEALLVREDNAQVTLGETSELELGGLLLRAGSAHVEALRDAVPFVTPAGEARFSFVALDLRRPRSRDEKLLEVQVQTGEARLPLPQALATAPGGTKLVLEGSPEEAEVRASAGTSTVLSQAPPDGIDPDVACILREGHAVKLRSLGKDGLAFLLDDDREVGFGPEKVGARLVLPGPPPAGEYPRVIFTQGAETDLEKGLHIRFGFEKGAPLARFKGGERVLLADSKLRVRIENPTIVFPDETTVGFTNAVSASLKTGEGLAGAVVGARKDDHFEVPPRTTAMVGRRGKEHTTFELQDRRRLWINDGAPTVQARMMKEKAQALSMPGTAPLTIASERKVTVLATREGEFIILDDPSLIDAYLTGEELRPLKAPYQSLVMEPTPNHLPELLNQPPPASPTSSP